MPSKPTWILELPRIQKVLEELDAPVVDRAGIERIFGVRRRRAIQLMHKFGGYQAGRTFLVERSKVIRILQRIARGRAYEWELARREKLADEIEKVKRLLPGRQVRIMVPAEALQNRIADLPPGVYLQPGELRIEFHGTEDLLRQLFELGQAIMNDYKKFEAICEQAEVQTVEWSDFRTSEFS
jgi:hypothetical protein